ncbi:uncharacterized protein LOC5520862 [Nematostella vectensis]|uniref:uncharacterized protein LOC5520862 n=1 Tax=Nematostella vectensis TaxID=45351 RepID=UPI002077606A|nr:uncharacterized protein LOC5520862 [Nematostella vectensis]XP_032221666.2 uncharacterized protein LOC5520862 [Nematostella vectensis]XP_048585668.1 uncharacterized protein LOC5520862 [Nematostella vectensis]
MKCKALSNQVLFRVCFFSVLIVGTFAFCGVKDDGGCLLPFPRGYVAYKLRDHEVIRVDGRLDEDEWKDVQWTEDFLDIQGKDWPRPRFITKVKMRWDSLYLYIGAYLQEPDVWANQTKHDSVVFQDNDFEVFINPDGSTHWYKEFEINAINTTWDLELNKPYLNGGTANSSWEMPTMKSAIYVDGPVNDPSKKDVYWTVELALPFKDLVVDNHGVTAPPKNADQWRINFSRVEWHVHVVDGHYEKVAGLPEDNWVWSPQYSINMHLPERWGFLQFSTDPVNTTKFLPTVNWPVLSSLIMVYDAEKKFFAVNGYFTSNVTQLELPSSLVSGGCHVKLSVDVLNHYNFQASVVPKDPELKTGHVKDDRLIWFT